MKEKLKKSILKHKLLNKGDKVGVAVSGGADSVCLLYFLNELKEELGIKTIVAIHVDHSIRGEESDGDAEFVKLLCAKLGIELYLKKVDAVHFSKEQGYTLEQGARILRYNVFEEAAKELGLGVIMLAHHQGDQAETILMHELRGCGLSGLMGMAEKSGIYARPMLGVTREEIEKSLLDKGIKWRTDSTNKDTKYARNFIRNVVLKEIKKVYPAAETNLRKLSEKMADINDFIEKCVPKDKIIEKNGGYLIVSSMASEHSVIKRRLVKECLIRLNAIVDVEDVHILGVINLLQQRVGKKINLPHGVLASREYDGVFLSKTDESTKQIDRPFKKIDMISTSLGVIEVKPVQNLIIEKGHTILDPNKVPDFSVWRTPKRGDKFAKFGGGTKSLTDYLTDKKISSLMRSKLIVLAHDHDILVIPGIEICDKVKIDKNTKEMVEICLKN